MRRHRSRLSNFAAGIIGAVVIVVVCYLVFGGGLPFGSSPFVLKAVYTTPTELHIPSPVRIAGVDVGQVTSVKQLNGSAGLITMQIDKNGLPIHADATASVRSRIFLEGNFYVDLHPGSPTAPTLSSGATLPAANTAGPVQLDRVLSSLNSDTRTNLQTFLQGFGSALNASPPSGDDVPAQDPSVRGLTGGQALNRSLQYSADALRASAIVNEGLLGIQPHDLSQTVVGEQRFLRGLADSGNQLSSLVHTFNSTMAALAARQQDLSKTIALLPPFLRAQNNADTALDSSFGPTREFAQAILPALPNLDPTIGYALPWLSQSTALFSPNELGGLLQSLTPAIQQTGNQLRSLKQFLGSADQLARCFTHNIIPAGNEVIQDPPVGNGIQVYQEFFQSAVGVAASGQNFDGNGPYLRTQPGGGSLLMKTAPVGTSGPLYGNAVLPPIGSRPAMPGSRPPIKGNVPCFKNPVPSLNNVTTDGRP